MYGIGIAAVVGLIFMFWILVEDVKNRTPEDYRINEVQINGRDCITIHEYSQVGITCDWSKP